jgi:hypothetical protein
MYRIKKLKKRPLSKGLYSHRDGEREANTAIAGVVKQAKSLLYPLDHFSASLEAKQGLSLSPAA